MTAKEVIEYLQTVPPDMPVFVQGYEGGWDKVYCLDETPLIKLEYSPSYWGNYDEPEKGDSPIIKAVIITGKSGS